MDDGSENIKRVWCGERDSDFLDCQNDIPIFQGGKPSEDVSDFKGFGPARVPILTVPFTNPEMVKSTESPIILANLESFGPSHQWTEVNGQTFQLMGFHSLTFKSEVA